MINDAHARRVHAAPEALLSPTSLVDYAIAFRGGGGGVEAAGGVTDDDDGGASVQWGVVVVVVAVELSVRRPPNE